jgi:hypothetical protein
MSTRPSNSGARSLISPPRPGFVSPQLQLPVRFAVDRLDVHVRRVTQASIALHDVLDLERLVVRYRQNPALDAERTSKLRNAAVLEGRLIEPSPQDIANENAGNSSFAHDDVSLLPLSTVQPLRGKRTSRAVRRCSFTSVGRHPITNPERRRVPRPQRQQPRH